MYKYLPALFMIAILTFSYIGVAEIFQNTVTSILFFSALVLSTVLTARNRWI